MRASCDPISKVIHVTDFITPEQMALEEKKAVEHGITVLQMMENAGSGVADVIGKRFGPLVQKRVLVVCGTGNNGGDGFVAARHLHDKGAAVTVLLVGKPDSIRTEEARRNWMALNTEKASADTPEAVNAFPAFDACDIVVAALTGTGMRGALREPLKTAVERVNSAHAVRVAIDLPSGLDPITGRAMPVAVKADVTVALHKPKIGLKNARIYTGEIVVVPIGVPD